MKFLPKIQWNFNRRKIFPIVPNSCNTQRSFPKPKWVRKMAILEKFPNRDVVLSCLPPAENLNVFIELPDPVNPPQKFLRRADKKTFMSDGTFYNAVGSVILMAEFFAVMPVKGVKAGSPMKLSFSWTNIRTIYCIGFILLSMFDTLLALNKVLNESINFNQIEPVVFRTSILIVCICFLNLAQKWPSVMVTWHEVETKLPQYTSQMDKQRMANKIKRVTFVLMAVSLLEHLLHMISIIHTANFCRPSEDPIKNYFVAENHVMFSTFPYSNWLAWLGRIQYVISSFHWNYMDIFVLIMSIGLSSKFKQLNDNLKQFKGMHMSENFWSDRRIQYQKLCLLCRTVDDAISVITFVSFSNNLCFICIQLLNSLNKMPTLAHALYFYFSLVFLFGRTLAVSLYSAEVHDESKKPLHYLRYIPRQSWYPEVKRFSEGISRDFVALTGMKFFHLTRKLVLSVTGTIITYELVLIQFHKDNSVYDC